MSIPKPIDWSKAKPEMIEEVAREAEAFLQAQLSVATSADQRAVVTASVHTAAGTALIAGLLAVASSDHAVDFSAMYWGGAVAALMLLGSGALCVAAAMPVGFYLPGAQPESWRSDIESGRDYLPALSEQAGNFQDRIASNSETMKRNARMFRIGAVGGMVAPIIGAATWWLVMHYC